MQNGTVDPPSVPAEQALEFSPNFSYQTHVTVLSIGRTHASEYKNSVSHVTIFFLTHLYINQFLSYDHQQCLS